MSSYVWAILQQVVQLPASIVLRKSQSSFPTQQAISYPLTMPLDNLYSSAHHGYYLSLAGALDLLPVLRSCH